MTNDNGSPRFVFRSLPGIAELVLMANADLASPRYWDCLEKTSRALFGVTRVECEDMPAWWFEEEGDLEAEDLEGLRLRYEQHFQVLFDPFKKQQILWNALDWDVTDGHGNPHPLLKDFDRQIIVAARGLYGHLPGEKIDAEAWGGKLQEAARAFVNRRRR